MPDLRIFLGTGSEWGSVGAHGAFTGVFAFCLGGLLHLGHLRVCAADFSVDPHGYLLLHGVGDMAVDVERGLGADVANHGGESLDIHTVFQRHGCEGVPEIVEADVLTFSSLQGSVKYLPYRRGMIRCIQRLTSHPGRKTRLSNPVTPYQILTKFRGFTSIFGHFFMFFQVFCHHFYKKRHFLRPHNQMWPKFIPLSLSTAAQILSYT